MKQFAIFILALALVPVVLGQSPATGFPPYGSFQPGGFDSVNMQNLNVNFAIGMISKPARGGRINLSAVYNSLNWQADNSTGTWTWIPTPNSNWGWSIGNPTGSLYDPPTLWMQICWYGDYNDLEGDYQEEDYNTFIYIDASGTQHRFPVSYDVVVHDDCASDAGNSWGTFTGYATDGSGYYIDISDFNYPKIFSPGGGRVGVGANSPTDRNGNVMTYGAVTGGYGWIDSTGHGFRVDQVSGTSNYEYHYADSTGTDQKYTVKYQNYSVMTSFSCSGVAEYNGAGTMPQVSLPYEIDLPNGKSYAFTYEQTPGNSSYITGRLKRVTLPTGGYYEYDYSSPNDGISCSDGTVVGLTRVINDGTNTNTWTYSRYQSGSSGFTTVTAPQMPYDSNGNVSIYTFNSSGQITQRADYKGSSTLLRTINYTWSTNGFPSTQITILDTNQQSEVATTFDSNGNLTQRLEYDWGSGAPGSLIRETDITYGSPSGYGFAPTQELVKNGSGTVIYREDRSYDGTTPTCVSGVTQHDDTDYGCSYNTRGNLTTITTYTTPATPSGGVPTTFAYDTLGNLLSVSVNGVQQKQLNFSSATVYAFPDSVTSGPSGSGNPRLTQSATYNAYTGAVATSTDVNGQVTNYGYDVLGRLTTVTRPDSTQLTTSYNDSGLTVTSTVPIDSTPHKRITVVAYDGLGRPITNTIEDASSSVYSITQRQYDPVGRGYKTSNPYTSSAAYWTQTQFDGIGRVVKTILPDSNYSTNSYSGNCTTVTDPAGKARKVCADGMGRLGKVFEDPSGLNYETDYTYNALDELTQVSQGSQTRSYTYDGMGRQTSSTTPEAGAVCIGTVSSGTCQQNGYNVFNLVATTTDARGVVTTNTYDTLNRLTGVSFNVGSTGVTGTTSIGYTYGTSSSSNNNGRLTQMTDGSGSESYTYDIFGRITQLAKVINGTGYNICYGSVVSSVCQQNGYNLAGEVTQITYPSGRVVVETHDAIGRLCGVGASGSTCSSGTSYVNAYGYNTAGEMTGFKYGNGVVANLGYTVDRLQLACLQYDTTSLSNPCAKDSSALFMLTYAYGSSGANNGQISGITDGMDNGRTASYTYDSLGRLSTATSVGSTAYPAWGLSWTYDQYGNRTKQIIASGCTGGFTCPYNSLNISPTTNKVSGSGFGYDANGNMTGDGSNTLTFDAMNTSISSSGSLGSGTYSYDGNGFRVKKRVPISNPTTTTVYIFSGGRVIAEYDNGAAVGSPTREYIYAGGNLIAKIAGTATTYYHQDHLSNRLVTSSSGAAVEQLGHLPFGEVWYDSSNEKWRFTTYERDSESANDYAMARYYVNRIGRFASPDPLGGFVANPQSMNHYSYAGNDPINMADPSGMASCDPGDAGYNSTAGVCIQAHEDDGDSWILTGGTICSFAGISADCSWGRSQGFQGCPNNACGGWNGNSQIVYYEAVEMGVMGPGGAYYSVFNGPGAMFTSFFGAGIAAENNINSTSIAENSEYAGQIYRDANGMFSYTPPQTWGQEAGSYVFSNQIPYNTQFVGDYHTHGAFSFNNPPGHVYLDEVFSGQDMSAGNNFYASFPKTYLGEFLATPQGRIEFYNPANQTVYFLNGVMDMTLFPWTYPRWP